MEMRLRILLPFRVFEDVGALRIVAESRDGSFGILPRRRDCVAALCPGILVYETEQTQEVYVAVDEGVLTKTGHNVVVCVRNAIAGQDLGQLRRAVEEEFMHLDEEEQEVRRALVRMESGLIRRMAGFYRD
ncbi:F-type H+-transporting ATPase subunit epsilon [Desulfomicrobium norvegicum]|uniref:ATP synthase epsilon chain n=1 Tax=Desulfomicrobium norvegicum (strain DSM 1741 / NCIMB 8310) TaxID=52561 RepID=A0A8G2FEV1_DESNO|nr:F0F1 ATP synthase subunit epsilon [Desulfomicrobium norvegicum]SFL86697.1 F-type H+-transporting ATPase subunit epsilon [Desulfomicrobium norvegicum]